MKNYLKGDWTDLRRKVHQVRKHRQALGFRNSLSFNARCKGVATGIKYFIALSGSCNIWWATIMVTKCPPKFVGDFAMEEENVWEPL